MNSNDINNIFKDLGKSKENDEKIKNDLFSKLNSDQKQTFTKALNDPEFLDKLLNSAQAKELISKFGNSEKGKK